MKNLFLVLFVLVGLVVKAQDVKKIVEGGKPVKFQKYIDKGGNLNEIITITGVSFGDEYELEMSLLVFIIGENQEEMFDIYLDNIDNVEEKEQVISEAFTFSLSREDSYYADQLYAMAPDLAIACTICNGNSALMTAATHGNKEWYFKLKDESDPLYINTSDATLIHAAANGGEIEILQDVLKIEGILALIDNKDNTGLTPLDYAIREADPAFVELLLKNGADHTKSKNLFYGSAFYSNVSIFNFDYVLNMEDRLFEEVWWHEGDGIIALDMATIWEDGFSTTLLDQGKSDQAAMIKSCLFFMSASFKSETFDACKAYQSIAPYKDDITMSMWNYVMNLYYYVETNLEDSEAYSELYSFHEEIMMEAANLHAIIKDKCGEYFITEKSYKVLTKYFGEDYVQDYFEIDGQLIEFGE